MVTASAAVQSQKNLPGRRFDRVFFGGVVALMLATVAIGFAHTYYLAGVVNAPLRSRVLHVHGIVFSTWMILLLVQTSLVAARQVKIHRRLGIAGMFMAGLVVIFGILAACDSLAHQGPQAPGPILSFSITPFTDMLLFANLAGSAFLMRKNSLAHKRLILFATIALMRAALFRWPFAFLFHNQVRAILVSYTFVLLLIAYDLWTLRRIHRATLWAASLLVVVHVVRVPMGQTAIWHGFARWLGTLRI